MKRTLTIILALTLTSCEEFEEFWGAGDCADDMSSTKLLHGEADLTVNADYDGDKMVEEWTYYDAGLIFTFRWGDGFDNCEVNTLVFTPRKGIR